MYCVCILHTKSVWSLILSTILRDFEIGQTSHQLPGRFCVILCLAVSYLWFFATLVYYLQVVGGCPVDCRFGPGSWGFWSGSRPFIVPETGPLFFVWLLDFWASIQPGISDLLGCVGFFWAGPIY